MATDDLSDSQGQILTNFSAANTSFGVNHYAFSDVTANNGKHTFLQMPQQAAAPATGGTELGLVTLDQAGAPQLCYRKPTNGAVIQLTGVDVVSDENGTTFLPGGMILKWGTFPYTSNPTTSISFPIAFPNNCFSVQVIPFIVVSGNLPQSARLIPVLQAAPSKTGFIIWTNSVDPTTIGYYMAIGN